MNKKNLLFGCLSLVFLAIILVSCTSYMMSPATETQEEKKALEKENKKRINKMDKEDKKEKDALTRKLNNAISIKQEDFDNKNYKHNQPLKIAYGKVSGVTNNELGIQTALVSMYDENNAVVGIYPIANYSEISLNNNHFYKLIGLYDLKTDDGEPSLNVWRVEEVEGK